MTTTTTGATTAGALTTGLRRTAPKPLAYVARVALALDLGLVTISVLAAMEWRKGLSDLPADYRLDIAQHLGVAGPLIVVAWIVAIGIFGGYRAAFFGAGMDEYKAVFRGTLSAAALLGIGCYLARFGLSRGFYVLLFLIGLPLLTGGRYVLRKSLHRARNRGAFTHRVVIAGSEGNVDDIASVLQRETWLGYQLVGAITPGPSVKATTPLGVPLLGATASLAGIARDTAADVVFLAGGAFDRPKDVRALAWELEQDHVDLVIAPSVTDVARERVSVRPVGGLPLVHLEKPRSLAAARRAKRTFDVVGSLCLLILCAPLIGYAAWRVWSHDRGPILFRQPRVGRDGAVFDCLKLRTMVMEAEDLLPTLHQQTGYDGGLFKMAEDPRVTAPGRLLRRYSIDELPQLVNVLRGEMSLVGPRPPLPHEVQQYDATMARRLRVRPGMTGLWQVSGRSELSWPEAIRLDVYYVDNWSMLQDVVILFRTVRAVLRPSGAY